MAIFSVVELDLVGYSDAARLYQQGLGTGAVAELNAQIQSFIDAGLADVSASRAEAVITKTGDGAILAFEHATTAFEFAIAVHEATRAFNSERSEASARRWFRIGIATGVLHKQANGAGWDTAGMVKVEAVRLEQAAEPGQILLDHATFEKLDAAAKSRRSTFEQISGKRNEVFAAHRFAIVKEAEPDPRHPATVESVLDMFDQLQFPQAQINRLLLLLKMPADHRPPESLTLFERKTRLLDWVERPGGPGLSKLAVHLKGLIKTQNQPIAVKKAAPIVIFVLLACGGGLVAAKALRPAPPPPIVKPKTCNRSIFSVGGATQGDLNDIGMIDTFTSTAIRGSQFAFRLSLRENLNLDEFSCLSVMICKVQNERLCSTISNDYPSYRVISGYKNSFVYRMDSSLQPGTYRLGLHIWQVKDPRQLLEDESGATQVSDGKLFTEERDFTLK